LKYPSLKKGRDMADIKKKLGVRISQLRMKAGMTQAKLAEGSDLSVDSISRIERGDRAPSLESLEKIAEALGNDPGELLNFKGKEFKALAEGPPECLELWNLLKDRKRTEIKKVFEIARILLS
jgi:transcriptional regulator with XRE-family HTH domain